MTDDVPTRAIRVPPELRLEAAARLVGRRRPNARAAARRMLAELERQSYANDMLFARIEGNQSGQIGPAGVRIGPVCMAVPSAGRAAMLFLSEPMPDDPDDHAGRVDAIRVALKGLTQLPGHPVGLAQALPDPAEGWATSALGEAGLVRVGNLLYLRRTITPSDGVLADGGDVALPGDITLRPLAEPGLHPTTTGWATLARALERSYIDTLDCPKLCGMRPIEDVIASHRAVGDFDASLWTLVEIDGVAEGCCLVSRTTGSRGGGAELVYMGLGPELRGRGVGRVVLARALARLARTGEHSLTCAVDEANTPARRLYDAFRFETFASRVGFVLPV